MKTATIIAIISTSILLLTNLYYFLVLILDKLRGYYEVATASLVCNLLDILAWAGLLCFFVVLYVKKLE